MLETPYSGARSTLHRSFRPMLLILGFTIVYSDNLRDWGNQQETQSLLQNILVLKSIFFRSYGSSEITRE